MIHPFFLLFYQKNGLFTIYSFMRLSWALAIISHSVGDFLSDSIKQYGQALLDIPCYKILMGTDGQNLKETAALYDLTEAEQELLLARKRGHALFLVGAKRLHIYFEIPDYKMAYMGTAGGR